VKLMLDGIVENYTASMLEPYLDDAGNSTTNTGLEFIDPTELVEIVRRLDRLGFQCHFHALGSRAVRNALNALAELPRRDQRHHLAHLQVVDRADVARFSAVGAIANCQPLWACNDLQMTELTLPFITKRSAGQQYPFGSLAQAGAVLAMGSDWSVSTADVYDQIQVAVTRTHPDNSDQSPLAAQEALTLEQALTAFTVGSATVNRVEKQVGRIELGMVADLAVADRNPFEIDQVAGTSIRVTIIAGDVAYSAS
jgi:predicted amidohydrolase YtcJ